MRVSAMMKIKEDRMNRIKKILWSAAGSVWFLLMMSLLFFLASEKDYGWTYFETFSVVTCLVAFGFFVVASTCFLIQKALDS
jgi:hypothetical protein